MNAAAQAAAARQQHRLFADSGRFNARCLNSGRAAESPESLTSGSSKPRCDAAAQAAAARQEHRLLTDQGMLLARFLPFWRTADLFSFFLRFLGYRCLRKKRPPRKKDVSPAPFYPKTMLAFCPGRSNGKACARHAHVALSWKCKWLQNKRPSANIPTLMWGLGGRARRIHM